MSGKHPRIKIVAQHAGRDPWRSPLFHWLRRNHARLAPSLSARRIDWEPVIGAASKAGVKDDKGGQPTRHTVWRTWRKVCLVVEAETAAEATKSPRKLQPRDLPADWRPTPIAVPALASAVIVPVPAAGQPPTTLAPLTHPDQVRVVGMASFGPITSGPLTPEPDYTGMGVAERKIARAKWHLALRQPG